MGAIRRTSALYFVACLDSLHGLFKASYLELPFGTPRNALSPVYDNPETSPLVRCRGSTAISLSRTSQRVPPRRTSSITYGTFLGGRTRLASVLAVCYLNAGRFLDVLEASGFCCFSHNVSRLSGEVKIVLLI